MTQWEKTEEIKWKDTIKAQSYNRNASEMLQTLSKLVAANSL